MSRGFSINLHHQDLCVALVDGEKYWKVCMASDKYSAGESKQLLRSLCTR